MRRGAEQRIRKFLANSFKNDGPASASSSDVSGSTAFVVRFSSIDGPLCGDISGLNVSFFNRTSKAFVGRSYRTEIGDEPITFHGQPAQISIVFESVRIDSLSGEETVSCWWHVPLESLLKTTSVRLYRGCAQLLYLDASAWPVPTLGATLYFEVLPPKVEDCLGAPWLPSLIPPLVCVNDSFVDSERFGAKPFRLVANRLVIQEQMLPGCTGMFEETGLWTALVFVHNAHLLLSPVSEVSLTVDRNGSLVSNRELQFTRLPPHVDANIVCCLRFKRTQESRFRALGFTCFNLLTGLPSFSDCDVNVSSVPFLKGPYSCEDPRCLSLEHEQPYAVLPLTMDIRLAYYDTPTPAPVWVEDIRAHKDASSPSVDGRAASRDHSPASAACSETPPSRRRSFAKKSDALPQKEDTSSQLPPVEVAGGVAGGGVAAASAGVDIYKLLTDIMDEVRQLKVLQSNSNGQTRESAPSQSHADPASPELALAALTDSRPSQSPKVQELQLRPVALPKRRQAAITEGVRPFVNPQTRERVLEAVCISDPAELPHSQLMLRFEGITYGLHGSPMPSGIVICASYSTLPLQSIGPISVRRVAEADAEFGPSFQFASADRSSGAGYMWCEPITSAVNISLREVTSNSNLYLHIYDALTMFYMASAIFKPSKVARPANVLMTTASFDLALFEDLSLAERDVPDAVPLIASTEVGYLHVTAAALGIPTPVTDRVVGSSLGSDATLSSNGGTVFVKKLPADFGDESRSAFQYPEIKPVGFDGLSDQKAGLHQLRANFVRGLLQNRDHNALAVHVNGGRLPTTESEHRLRYVDKRRDEVKSSKIAEALKARITTKHSVTAWFGASRTVSTVFANPFPVQSTFRAEIPTSSPHISLHPSTAPVMTLAPHESVTIKAIISVFDPSTLRPSVAPVHTQLLIRTLTNEVSRIIDFSVSIVPPVVHRRYDIFGGGGEKVSRRFHSRAFPSSPNVSALGALCHYCRVLTAEGAGVSCTAETRAVVEPLSPAMVAAWEEVIVSVTMPREGTSRVFVILYKDAEMTDVWETWDVSLTSVQRFHTQQVYYGQMNVVTLPIVCESAFASDPNVTTVTHRDCVVLKVRPRSEGALVFHLRVSKAAVHGGAGVERMIVSVPCVLPRPSYEDAIDITYSQSGATIHRLLTFTNREARQKKFHVSTNFAANINVQPAHFVLAPFEVKQLRIQIFGLNYLGGEGQWPMWIFINDDEDLTVDSYLIRVTVREHQPPIAPLQ